MLFVACVLFGVFCLVIAGLLVVVWWVWRCWGVLVGPGFAFMVNYLVWCYGVLLVVV